MRGSVSASICCNRGAEVWVVAGRTLPNCKKIGRVDIRWKVERWQVKVASHSRGHWDAGMYVWICNNVHKRFDMAAHHAENSLQQNICSLCSFDGLCSPHSSSGLGHSRVIGGLALVRSGVRQRRALRRCRVSRRNGRTQCRCKGSGLWHHKRV